MTCHDEAELQHGLGLGGTVGRSLLIFWAKRAKSRCPLALLDLEVNRASDHQIEDHPIMQTLLL
jgi:hypothetical protein